MAKGLISSLADLDRQDAVPFALVIGAVLLVVSLVAHARDPLRSIPGPFWAKWTPLWMIYHVRKRNIHRHMIKIHEKYGPLVRVGPNEVSTSNPEALRVIYGAGTGFRKSDWYCVWQGIRKWDLFGERNEDIHRGQRRLVSNIYSLSNMKKLEPYVNNTVKLFLSNVFKADKRSINLSLWIQLFAFDVIGEVTFSKPFGFLKSGTDNGTFQQIDNTLACAAWVGYMPWLYWLNFRLSPYIGSHLAVTSRQTHLLTFTAKSITERKAQGSDHEDILEQLFEVQKEKPEFDQISITSMCASNIFAGSDSTALSISSIVYNVVKTPGCKEKLMAEIEATALAHNIQPGEVFSLETANTMPYLQACMWEGLRCHPGVGMNLGRVVPSKGIEYEGRFYPGGTVLSASAWVLHRDKETFGEDADHFRPERWDAEPERVAQMRRSFFAFGAGSRFCIGRNVAWLEMSKLIPTFFREFDIKLVDPNQKLEESAVSFVKILNLDVTLTPRKAATNGHV
ncbi:hypothetical protein LOZ65_003126 [Ophidiomyces ophidiicola]|nr:hypothetical protein LOZ65_003126 [Ophidiomyces ophidiicola]